MKTFNESLGITMKILVIAVLVLVVVWFFGGFDKAEKTASPVVQPIQQCLEHTFCDGQHQVPEVKTTVVVLKEILPKPPPCGVQEINIDNLTVQTQIINNDVTEVYKPEPRHVVEEPVQQGALIEYTDRSGGHSEVRSSSYGGTYYYGGGFNTSRGGGGWNSQNATVHQGSRHNWQRDTRCGQW